MKTLVAGMLCFIKRQGDCRNRLLQHGSTLGPARYAKHGLWLGSALGRDPLRRHRNFTPSLSQNTSLSFSLVSPAYAYYDRRRPLCLGFHRPSLLVSPTEALTVANVEEDPKLKVFFSRLYHQSQRLPVTPGT